MFSLPSRSTAASSRICCSVPRWIENCGHLYPASTPRASLQIGLPCFEKYASSLVRTAAASSRSCRPSSISSRTACGNTLMPTPSGFSSDTLSNILAGTPIWCRLSASVNPPMPPPAMRTVMMRPRDPAWSWHGSAAVGNCEGLPSPGEGGRRHVAPLTSGLLVRIAMFKLYFAPGTCALASHIALEEAGAPYTTVKLDFKANQQNSPEYLKINPKGRVPSLVTDRGILTETPAMLAFIAQSFPQAKLSPLDDAFEFAKVQAINSYLCSTV